MSSNNIKCKTTLKAKNNVVARSIAEPKYNTLETNYEVKILKKDKLPILGFLLQGQ
jgi:hypothetical protein